MILVELDKMIYIGTCEIFKWLTLAFFDLGCLSFFTYGYIKMSNDDKLQTTSVLFALYILIGWIAGFLSLKSLIISIKYYGASIEDDIWTLLKVKSKIYNVLVVINLCLGLYFMIIIGPFFRPCNQYNPVTCLALQLIGFFAFLEVCVIALTIMTICLNQQCNNYLITQVMERYNPLPEPESATQCPICLEHIDGNPNKRWISLSCKHVIHEECLNKWLDYGQICPHCRKQILLMDTINYIF
jgi:hypothetical protein